ncbi:zinc-binding dehydrogenase [Pseudomassariella vexata]|uniref:Zinc-binding dehydrogenase n=1 Tax=Pseudomassariella vexata TaxID=1141098 RepID=A0A1Y2EJF0_9PEZI|nr:zinc-binding dehydrogenase [Pseudomassariella vexata]ORY71681.1 zinc-binding dehydrogenase [Pseudomassariella vexata]
MSSIPGPNSHPAVVITQVRSPLSTLYYPNLTPKAGEIRIRVEWTASSPLELHQADGGLLIQPPHIIGSSAAGTVMEVGPSSSPTNSNSSNNRFEVGDKVFGYSFKTTPERCGQVYITAASHQYGKVPAGMSLAAVATVPANLVTVFRAAHADLGLDLPWPKPKGWEPAQKDDPILIWGAAGSVGMYAIQVFRHWGYENLIAVASSKHHEVLRGMGAKVAYDYNEHGVVGRVSEYASRTNGKSDGPKVPYIFDCIGSLEGTLRPLAEIAEKGTKAAILLPVIVKDATATDVPEYELDVTKTLPGKWAEGVELNGVRAHFWEETSGLKDRFMGEIMPTLLEEGIVQANKQRIVEGETMLERAQTALDLLREKAPSGERLVWRVADDEWL